MRAATVLVGVLAWQVLGLNLLRRPVPPDIENNVFATVVHFRSGRVVQRQQGYIAYIDHNKCVLVTALQLPSATATDDVASVDLFTLDHGTQVGAAGGDILHDAADGCAAFANPTVEASPLFLSNDIPAPHQRVWLVGSSSAASQQFFSGRVVNATDARIIVRLDDWMSPRGFVGAPLVNTYGDALGTVVSSRSYWGAAYVIVAPASIVLRRLAKMGIRMPNVGEVYDPEVHAYVGDNDRMPPVDD